MSLYYRSLITNIILFLTHFRLPLHGNTKSFYSHSCTHDTFNIFTLIEVVPSNKSRSSSISSEMPKDVIPG